MASFLVKGCLGHAGWLWTAPFRSPWAVWVDSNCGLHDVERSTSRRSPQTHPKRTGNHL